MITVSEYLPPPLPPYGVYWERSLDPMHPDAFAKLHKQLGKSSIMVFLNGFLNPAPKHEPRKQGWMLIDYSENPVGFVPDGTIYEHDDPCEYIMRMGPCKHVCAYPPDEKQRMEYHANCG